MLLPRRLIRFGFHLLYNQLAFTYDTVAWLVSFGQWQAWAATSLDWLRGPRVLELGHGPGHLLVRLARLGARPIGIDLSPNMLRMAQRRLRRAGLSVPQARVRAPALPFRSSEFDTVVATFPTDYITQVETLREVRRVLKADGQLIIVMGASLGHSGLSARFIDWLYTITGQREAAAEEASVFEQAGLTVQVETQMVGRSQVALLIARQAQAA